MFSQSHEVGIVFDKNWNIKFGLQQFSKIDIRLRKNRAPEGDPAVGINKSRQSDANAADVSQGFTSFLQAGPDAANDQSNQLRRT